MHFDLSTSMVAAALISAIVLVLHREDRLFPVIAAVAAGLEALIAFRIISLSSGSFRIDVILPGILLVAGVISWSRTSTKATITSATIVSLIGAIQLLGALGVLR